VSEPKSNNDGQTKRRGFQPGNTFGRGRQDGSRNKATVALDRIGAANAEAIARVVVAKALEGDLEACGIILRRAWPARKGAPLQFKIRKLKALADVPGALSDVLEAVTTGTISIDEGGGIAGIVETARKVYEQQELLDRMQQLEAKLGIKR
jgi:hypothetical protein